MLKQSFPPTLLGISPNYWTIPWENQKKYVCATLYDLTRYKYVVVNPRHTTFRVESYTVSIQHTTCRICDSMQNVVAFRRESVVLQVSNTLCLTGNELVLSVTENYCLRIRTHNKRRTGKDL